MWVYNWKKVSLGVLLVVGGIWSAYADSQMQSEAKTDTLEQHKAFSEITHIYKTRRVSSTYPIDVKVKRGSLLVTSKYSQKLPVYKANGVFYGLFRLNKGTNWISGLPRGTYIINNAKVIVS